MRQATIMLLAVGAVVAAGSVAPAQAPLPTCSPEEVEAALAGTYQGPPCRFAEMPARPITLAGPDHPDTPVLRHRPAMRPPAPVRSAPIALPDSFFTGPQAGGVERPVQPIYSYRGVILIDAAGRSTTGHDGLGHRQGIVRAMDGRYRPSPRTAIYQ